jgi:hypothetical protein
MSTFNHTFSNDTGHLYCCFDCGEIYTTIEQTFNHNCNQLKIYYNSLKKG